MSRALRRLAGSLRVRITLTALLAVGVALWVAAGVVGAALKHDRQRVLSETVQEQARVVLEMNPKLTAPLELPGDATIQSGLVQVLRGGQVVGASRPLRNLPPLWITGQPLSEQSNDVLGDLANDVHVVAIPVSSVHSTIVVVASLDQYDSSVAYLRRLLSLGVPFLLVVVGAVSWVIVGRALQPIERMRREVAEVATVTGGHRVAEPANDDEVGRLARTLNSMLDRIRASSERERRFVADASHELRSPIANVRTELEVALHHPHTADWPEVAARVLHENERMEELVAGLLLLARFDEGSLPHSAEVSDLAAVASAAAGGREQPGRPIVVEAQPSWVPVPRIYLEPMVTNLVDNARRFARSEVRVSVSQEDGFAVLRVTDDGPGVPEDDRERIFQRFVRLDPARQRGEGGFGLGLAIVADLSRFYGGSIELTGDGPGARFVLRLPSTAPPAGNGQPVGQVGAGEGWRTDAEISTVPGASASTAVHR